MPFPSQIVKKAAIFLHGCFVDNLTVLISKDTYRYGVRARRPVMVRLLVLAAIFFTKAELQFMVIIKIYILKMEKGG